MYNMSKLSEYLAINFSKTLFGKFNYLVIKIDFSLKDDLINNF